MKYPKQVAVVLAAALAFASNALARAETAAGFGKRWEGRIYVNVNGGLQTLSPDLAYEHVDESHFESMSGAVRVQGADGRVLEVSCGLRLFGNFGMGVTYSRYGADQLADLTSTYRVGGQAPLRDQIQVRDLRRTENTVHIQAVYVIAFTPRVLLGVFGGPSYFETRQDVIIHYAFDTYGGYRAPEGVYTYYPEPGFIRTDEGSAWGYNVGADLGFFFTKNIGVGFTARYTAASVDYENPIDRHEITHGVRDESLLQVVPLDMGGLQLVGGVRFRF